VPAAVVGFDAGLQKAHTNATYRELRERFSEQRLIPGGRSKEVLRPTAISAGIAFAGSPLAGLADAISVVMLVWLAFVVHRAIEMHYGVAGDQALAIFIIGGLAFYLLPLILIGILLVAIVVAAAILEYF
jgi:hypothetical protein